MSSEASTHRPWRRRKASRAPRRPGAGAAAPWSPPAVSRCYLRVTHRGRARAGGRHGAVLRRPLRPGRGPAPRAAVPSLPPARPPAPRRRQGSREYSPGDVRGAVRGEPTAEGRPAPRRLARIPWPGSGAVAGPQRRRA